MSMGFDVDGWEVWLCCVLLALLLLRLFIWKRKQPVPHLLFSKAEQLEQNNSPSELHPRVHLPAYCKWMALSLLFLAFLNPRLILDKPQSIAAEHREQTETLPIEGAAIYLVLDNSGSMKDTIFSTSERNKEIALPKMTLLKEMTKKFIEGDASHGLYGRPNDLIGLVTFARTAKVLSPLTLDHATLLQMLSKVDVIDKQNLDGTALGYALFKTINLISATRSSNKEQEQEGGDKTPYDIKSAAIIAVTDGFQYPNPQDQGNRLRTLDVDEAAQYAKEHQVKLYIVNMDPKIAEGRFLPIRDQMKRAAEMTGGRYYFYNDNMDLQQIYADIDQLEKSVHQIKGQVEIAPQVKVDTMPLFPYLIAAALLILAIGIGIESLLWRQVP